MFFLEELVCSFLCLFPYLSFLHAQMRSFTWRNRVFPRALVAPSTCCTSIELSGLRGGSRVHYKTSLTGREFYSWLLSLCEKCNNSVLVVSEVAPNSTANGDGCVRASEVTVYVFVGIALGVGHSTTPQSQGPTRMSDYNRGLCGLCLLLQNVDNPAQSISDCFAIVCVQWFIVSQFVYTVRNCLRSCS